MKVKKFEDINETKSYLEQYEEIKKLLNRIDIKTKNFAEQTKDSPYYDDLYTVIEELKELDSFLNDKYLENALDEE